ncbi:MAG: FlgD immunoglobulin-like domain containing protein, partial [bacterium]
NSGWVTDTAMRDTWLANMTFSALTLQSLGWNVTVRADVDWPTLQPLLQGPDVRALILHTHGRSDGRMSFPRLNDLAHAFTPAVFAGAFPSHQLDFLYATPCYYDPDAYRAAFPWAKMIPPQTWLPAPPHQLGPGLVHPPTERDVERVLRRAGLNQPCNPPSPAPLSSDIALDNGDSFAIRRTTDSQCPSLAICDDQGTCGTSLYPPLSCVSVMQPPSSGSVVAAPADASFLIEAAVPAAYQDSVAITATLFERLPEEFVAPDATPIPRHLMFSGLAKDAAVTVGPYELRMQYSNDDLRSSGVVDESTLRVGFLSASGSFVWMPAVADTAANLLECTVTGNGIASIYSVGSIVPTLVHDYQVTCAPDACTVRWQVAASVCNEPFHVERSVGGGPYLALSGSPIERLAGCAFQFRDADVSSRQSYRYRVYAVGDLLFEGGAETQRMELSLSQNYPNPMGRTTSIDYTVPEAGGVRLQIFSIQGRLVRVLVSEEKRAGLFHAAWDGVDSNGKPVPAGVYICRLSQGKASLARKMTLAQ